MRYLRPVLLVFVLGREANDAFFGFRWGNTARIHLLGRRLKHVPWKVNYGTASCFDMRLWGVLKLGSSCPDTAL